MSKKDLTIEVDTSTIKDMVKNISNYSSKIIVENEKSSIDSLKISAQNFIDKYITFNKISTEIQNRIQEAQIKKEELEAVYKDSNDIDIISENYITARNSVTQFLKQQSVVQLINVTYQAGFKFQEELSEFLNKKIQTVYVWVGSKGIPETYILEPGEFLKQDVSSSGNVVMRYSAGKRALRAENRGKLSKSLEEQIENNDDSKKNDIKNLQSAYQEVKSRYDTNRRKKKNKTIQGGYVLWKKNDNKWTGVLVNNMGSINEAYADALLKLLNGTLSNIPNESEKEKQVALLGKKILEVTSLSGLMAGDVTIGNIESAIKSNKATTLGLDQIGVIAQGIVKPEFTINEENVNKLLEENLSSKGNLNKRLGTIAGKEMSNVMTTIREIFDK